MPRKVGRQEASRMMYLLFAVMFLFALSPLAQGIARAISRRGVPRGCYIRRSETLVDVLGGLLTTGLVAIGCLLVWQGGDENAVVFGVVFALFGGGGALFILSLYLSLFRPNPKAAQEQQPKQGWEVSFGQAIWTADWRPRAVSVFGVWRQAFGLVHFVDGLEVLHFDDVPCDNGGKINVKLVLAPSSPGITPTGFWEAVEQAEKAYAELVKTQAKVALSTLDIHLWHHEPRDLVPRPEDTIIDYYPPPERRRPFMPLRGQD